MNNLQVDADHALSQHLPEEEIAKDSDVRCHHCDEPCKEETLAYEGHYFCCVGCKSIYELFQTEDLRDLYATRNKTNPHLAGRYDFLKNDEIRDELLAFQSEDHSIIILSLPDIHCSSCVYVLENLSDFHQGVIQSKVDFLRKTVEIRFNPKSIALTELAALLSSIGYPPQFEKASTEKTTNRHSGLSVKIGIAAFCFGNIMLLSFPEYLGIDERADTSFTVFFSYLNILLSIPLMLISARDYLLSAINGIRRKFINIDVPIALGIVALFGRSVYEIVTGVGAGYLDSLGGLIFFLLIGKWFQSKTYQNLAFERDYKSYFPMAVNKMTSDGYQSTAINKLEVGDEIMIRNNEIVPADAVLLSDGANIDYSFVTGEERAVHIQRGEQIYAGGRQLGERISLRVVKASSQSYLTSLWNNHVFSTHEGMIADDITNRVSKYFTTLILIIASAAAVYWYFADASQLWQVVTAVLIVACPCALALSAPFANGNALRIFGRKRLYLKSAPVAERFSLVDTIVFDKTGTLTQSNSGYVTFHGTAMSSDEAAMVRKLVENSLHPVSKKILRTLTDGEATIKDFEEVVGQGIQGVVNGHRLKLGSRYFVKQDAEYAQPEHVYLSIDGVIRGYFAVMHNYREGLRSMMAALDGYKLVVLSGDNDLDKHRLKEIVGDQVQMHFNQKPQDKLNFIEKLQQQGHRVMMLGDGLNDAGALKQSNVGIAVTEDIASFSPACDGILEGNALRELDKLLRFAQSNRRIIWASFVVSFLYNIVGVGFAVAGAITPIFAAILMPLSSLSVVVLTTAAGNIVARKMKM